jgi:hypothetical protein
MGGQGIPHPTQVLARGKEARIVDQQIQKNSRSKNLSNLKSQTKEKTKMKHTNNTKNTCCILTVMRFAMLFVLLVAMLLPAQMTLASTTTNATGPLPTSPSWTAESNQANSGFGYSVSAAGDVNGDGYNDVIVGAFNYSNGEENEGKVFVYYGSASGLNATPDWTAESNQSGAELGYSVGAAGDVNGDGYADVIVGAHRYQNGQPEEGAVFVWYGSANGLGDNGTPANADWKFESDTYYTGLGTAVSTAGDVNGDGYNDVIVGAAAYDNGTIDSGKAYVFYGSASGLSASPNWSAVGDVIYRSYYGTAVTAGDLNDDGYADVIVGAHNCTNPPGNGKAYV